jgi:hypothetical protein
MPSGSRRRVDRLTVASVAAALALVALTRPVFAHGGSLGQAARDSISVPTWLVLLTGGAAVGASFLLASFATDRAFVASLHEARPVSVPGRDAGATLLGVVGVAGLAFVLAVGFAGPQRPAISNAAVTVVWAGWWAGFAMSTYLAGNAWPALNPWRTLTELLPRVGRRYDWRLGAWPSVAGLLALIWLEVVSPLADRPRLLATTVLAYSVVTVAGAVVYGPSQWFEQADPVARVFRYYGAVAPVGVVDGRLVVRLPGAGLTDDVVDGFDEVAFVVALLWVTTFDGLVTTPAWRGLADWFVGRGLPPVVLYPLALAAGFAFFLAVYVAAARRARRTAESYVTALTLARRFAPSLLAIAAGYHVAHFLGYFLTLSPALVATVTAPLSTLSPSVIVLPEWFGLVAIAGVLGGHVVAIAAAHATAFDLFPGRLQAIRSQYPFIVAMIFYTVVSLWVVTRPEVTPPYI